jgi:predicted GNAT family acetyltransferase
MQRSDYILRMIERLGQMLIRLRRMIAGQVDRETFDAELSAIARTGAVDIEVARLATADTLVMLISQRGEVEPSRCWLLAELLYLDGLQARAEDRTAEARDRFEKAVRLFSLVEPGGVQLVGWPEASERIAEIQTLVDSGGALRVHRFADAGAFLDRAEPWLLEYEAENNLILGIAGELRMDRQRYAEPAYLATIEDGDVIVGCAFRTPPFKLGITRMPDEAAAALARAVRDLYAELPAVLGPDAAARAFAEAWASLTGTTPHVVMRSRIHVLTEVAADLPTAAGSLRTATQQDYELIARWIDAFSDDARMPQAMTRDAMRRRLARGNIVLWEVDGEPVSMAATVGPTRNGIRVGYVYTPPAQRGRGYATACVATLSRRMLAAGRKLCVLYTDVDNPTSNAIYARIGYHPVCDVLDIAFDASGAPDDGR